MFLEYFAPSSDASGEERMTHPYLTSHRGKKYFGLSVFLAVTNLKHTDLAFRLSFTHPPPVKRPLGF